MKNILKKIIGTAALLSMAAALAGCGGKSADSIAKKALKALDGRASGQMEAEVDMTAKVTNADMGEMNLDAVQTSTVDYTNDPVVIYTKGNYQQKIDDSDLTTDIETYIIEEDGKLYTYTHLEDIWMRVEGASSVKGMAESVLNAIADKKGTALLGEEDQMIDDQQVWQIHASIPAGELKELMATGEGLLGYVGDSASMPEIVVDLYVNKDSGLPVKISADLIDCGNAMISAMEGASGEFTKYHMTMTYKAFDSVGTLELPQEARDSAIDTTNLSGGTTGSDGGSISMPGGDDESRQTTGYDIKGQQNADGKYEIRLEDADNVAYVGVPDGFKENNSSLYHLSLINDANVFIDYTFADMYAADTIAAEYKEMMSYIEDNEAYSNINFSEPETITAGGNKVTYVCLTYDYQGVGACAEYLTWTENNNILFTVQITGLAAVDDNLLKTIYENVSFK